MEHSKAYEGHPAADGTVVEITCYNALDWPPEFKLEVPCFHEIVSQKGMCSKISKHNCNTSEEKRRIINMNNNLI